MHVLCYLAMVLLALILSFNGASIAVWSIAFGLALLAKTILYPLPLNAAIVTWGSYAVCVLLLNQAYLRSILAYPILRVFKRSAPTLSATEEAALMAGNVAWEAELFTAMPNWNQCLQRPATQLSAAEKFFLDGPVEQLFTLCNEWSLTQQDKRIPDKVLDYLKTRGFFGLVIPESYGGMGFSAMAHAKILSKIAAHSTALATVVCVPNSLGPAELLLSYGTEEQKKYYLPRLANGDDIPCFALTSPHAGSDAGGMIDHGVVTKAIFEGKEQHCIRLNWNKRYITLAPIATLIGLAFKLTDPEGLLGGDIDLGITCALIPRETAGVRIGRQHYPLYSVFPNGPIQGKDVLIPVDWIIGGQAQAGQGWQMLMSCLAAGRAISLPSMSLGGMKKALYTTAVYARIRKQFGVQIAQFEGVAQPLAEIAGLTFLAESLREFAVSGIDHGDKAAVASAIAKANTTEMGRHVLLHAMDILAGKAICMGPNNPLAQSYIESPIAITVEGANILTRSMMIFGQGAIRCHPYILKAMLAARSNDRCEFASQIFAHMGFTLTQLARVLGLSLARGVFAAIPSASPYKKHFRRCTRMVAIFSCLADTAMLVLGGRLKRLESLSSRLAAMLSEMYMASAVLRYAHQHDDIDLSDYVDWAVARCLHRAQSQALAFCDNFPRRLVGRCLKRICFPFGQAFAAPSDCSAKRLLPHILSPTPVRECLLSGLYRGDIPGNPIGCYEKVLNTVMIAEPIEQRVHAAKRSGRIVGMAPSECINQAIAAGIITEYEGQACLEAHALRMQIINVDDFEDLGHLT